jgi:hypothetical protein
MSDDIDVGRPLSGDVIADHRRFEALIDQHCGARDEVRPLVREAEKEGLLTE